jgi:phage gpG-like protein
MLKIGVSGTFLKPNVDWSERMDKIRQRMLEDSKAAFQGGGYYQEWPLTRDGKRATLSGVQATLESDSDESMAKVSAMNTIHQRGGVYKASDKQRRFLFATHPEWRGGQSTGQGMTLRFPKRTYLQFTDEFIKFATLTLGTDLFTTEEFTTQGE